MTLNSIQLELKRLALEIEMLETPKASVASLPDWIRERLKNLMRDVENQKRA